MVSWIRDTFIEQAHKFFHGVLCGLSTFLVGEDFLKAIDVDAHGDSTHVIDSFAVGGPSEGLKLHSALLNDAMVLRQQFHERQCGRK